MLPAELAYTPEYACDLAVTVSSVLIVVLNSEYVESYCPVKFQPLKNVNPAGIGYSGVD